MPRGRPLLRRLRLPFRHECIGMQRWCWLEGSNLPPLAYEASALPDELSQPRSIRKRDKEGRECRSRCGSASTQAPGPAPASKSG